jgi:hypothetical protein
MTARPYATPAAFKQAVETRLKTASSTGLDFGRRRQLLVFERFLARIAPLFGNAATLKGGLALELRLEAPCVHDAAQPAEQPREGPSRSRAPRDRWTSRREAPARRHRADVHVPHDPSGADRAASSSRCVDRAIREDGGGEPAALANALGSCRGGESFPGHCARRRRAGRDRRVVAHVVALGVNARRPITTPAGIVREVPLRRLRARQEVLAVREGNESPMVERVVPLPVVPISLECR